MSKQDTTNLAISGTRSTELVQASLHASAPQRSIERARHNMRNATIGLTFLVGFCLPQCAPIAFAHTNAPLPPEYSAPACYSLVEGAGRAIAWARWEKHLSREKTRSAPFRPNTPAWVIDLVKGWIDAAYEWRATDQQIRQWAAELGSVEDLPSADALSMYEKIAIWMRRIGRQCAELDLHARTSAKLMGGDVSVAQ
jgi:hypothetical protein